MPLYINQDVIIINNQKENTIFLFDRKIRTKSIINEDMFEILNFIYEHEGITIKEFSKYYSDLEDVLNQLLDIGTLKKEKQKRCHNIKKITNLDTARVFVELTDKCNLRCKHCYGDFKLENQHSLNLELLNNLINQAIELNVYQFDLTGGEPLLYKELKELLSKLYDAGMLVTIFSNLTIQNDKILDLFEKCCVKKVITSVDSNIAQNHDKFRGMEGAFEKTISNIRRLKKTSIELSVNTMVGTHNENNIDETILFLKELNVPCVLDAIIPNGRANKLDENTFKSVQIIHDLYKNKELNVELKITDCGVGKRFLYIKSNGNVCLCPSLITERFIFGNINDKGFDLSLCWNKMVDKYGDLECKEKCSKKELCNGGCRARALLFKESLYDRDINSCILCGECNFNEIK